jgi:hypothetical protein
VRCNICLKSILVLVMLQIRFLLCIQHAPSVNAIHHGALWDTCGTCEAICTKAVIGIYITVWPYAGTSDAMIRQGCAGCVEI